MRYAVITPARNEAENLRRLARCLARQTRPPSAWIVIDDASTDDTFEVASAISRERPWAHVIRSADASARTESVGEGRRVGKEGIAFEAGLAALPESPDVVVKVDADISMAPDYFERLLAEFAADESLGIAGGLCHELEDGDWRPVFSTGTHVSGATQAYRYRCLQEILPLEARLGFDGIAVAKANACGWSSRTIFELEFLHHRKTGGRDGQIRAWIASGETLHYMGYRPSYLVTKALFRSLREPAAVALVWGYVRAALRRHTRVEPAIRAHVREGQRLRSLPLRAREALGRR